VQKTPAAARRGAAAFCPGEFNFSQRVNGITDRNNLLRYTKGRSGSGKTAPHFSL